MRGDGQIGHPLWSGSDAQLYPRAATLTGAGVEAGGRRGGRQDEQVARLLEHQTAGGVGPVRKHPGGVPLLSAGGQFCSRPAWQRYVMA